MRSTVLLVLRWRSFVNALHLRPGATIRRTALFGFLALCWCVTIGTAVGTALTDAFTYAAAAPNARHALEVFALTVAVTGAMLLALFLENGTAVALMTSDVDRLLVAPVPARRVVRAKMIAALPYAVGLTLPGVIACGIVASRATSARGWALLTACVLAVFLGVIVLSVSTLCATLVARTFPRRRAVVVLETAAAVTGAVFGLLLLWSGHSGRITDIMHALRAFPDTQPSLGMRVLAWSPGAWAARAIDAAAHREGLSLALALVVLAGSAVACGAWAEWSGAALYTRGWTPHEARSSSARGHSARPAASRGLTRKDWLLFRRAPLALSGLLRVGGYMVLAAFLTRDSSGARAVAPQMAAIWIGYDVGSHILALDRLAFWRVRVAPVGVARLVRAKLLAACGIAMPFAACGCAILALIARRDAADAVLTGVGLAVAGAACGLIVGAHCTNFAWTHRANMLTTAGQWLFAVAVSCPMIALLLLRHAGVETQPAGAALVALACCAIALPAATASVERLQWNRSSADAT